MKTIIFRYIAGILIGALFVFGHQYGLRLKDNKKYESDMVKMASISFSIGCLTAWRMHSPYQMPREWLSGCDILNQSYIEQIDKVFKEIK